MIATFLARIFAIANEHHSFVCVEITILDPTYFLLSHCGGYSKFDDTSHWYLLTWIRVEACDKAVEFVLCRTTIAFIAFSNKA